MTERGESYDAKIISSGGGATNTNCIGELKIETVNISIVVSELEFASGSIFRRIFGKKVSTKQAIESITVQIEGVIKKALEETK